MYGLPDSNPLSQAVHELVSTHERTVGELTGQEPGLLHQLTRAIASDTAGADRAGGKTTGSPLNVNALALHDEIFRCIGEFWPGRGDLKQATTPLTQRLRMWCGAIAGTEYEPHLLEMCLHWARQIRELLEPPKRIPLWGAKCPCCEFTKGFQRDQYGETVLAPALLIHASEAPMRAECLICESEWKADEINNLGAVSEFDSVGN